MGQHHRPEDTPPGPDTHFPRHSEEERSAETSAMTSIDFARQHGILPRSTPPQGYEQVRAVVGPGRPPTAPWRVPGRDYGPAPSHDGEEPGYGVSPPIISRVIAALVVIVILVGVILILRG